MRSAWAMGVILAVTAAAGADLVLVDGRDGRAVIVIPARPSAVVRYAADELVYHVEKATGVRLAVVSESAATGDPAVRVYIGPCAAARKAGLAGAKTAAEECQLKTVGRSLLIVGDDSPGDPLSASTRAGTLWGVYELLEETVGVRWLWPGELGTFVPKASRLAVGRTDRRVRPWLIQRRLRSGLHLRGDTARGFSKDGRKRYARDQAVFLRRHRMGQSVRLRYGHAFGGWWKQYGRRHPEWFQLLAGGRRGPSRPDARFSMCVSNPQFHRQIVAKWQALCAKRPGESVNINCCENDIRGLCTCKRCTSWDGPQPSTVPPRFGPRVVSDRYARFWLAVQQLAAKTDPDATVVAYAYVNYAPPPSESIRLNDHIFVGTVPDLFFPRTPQEQEWVRDQWDGWARTGGRMFLRPNYFLGGYCMPQIFAHQFADEFRHEAAGGMAMTDFDSLTGQWATQGPNLYVLMRLHVRPKQTAPQLLSEYYSAFGPAAAGVKTYFDYWRRHTEANRQAMRRTSWSRWPSHVHKLYTPASLAAAERILDTAARSAAADRTHAARVAFLRTGLTHARLATAAAAAFDDGVPMTIHRALTDLMRFRRKHEHENFSNLQFCSWLEGRCWHVPDGVYTGGPLRGLAGTIAPLPPSAVIPARGRHTFVVLPGASRHIRARIACRQLGTYTTPVRWRLLSSGGESLADGTITPGKHIDLDRPIATAGAAVLLIDSGANVADVRLLSNHAALSGRSIHLCGRSSPLYFHVPAGRKRLRLTLRTPAPGETARMTIHRPDGQVAATGSTGRMAEFTADMNVPPGCDGRVWSVTVAHGGRGAFEDYTLILDPAAAGFWAHAPDRLVTPKE